MTLLSLIFKQFKIVCDIIIWNLWLFLDFVLRERNKMLQYDTVELNLNLEKVEYYKKIEK